MKWIAGIGILVLLSGSGSQVRKLLQYLGGETSSPAITKNDPESGQCRLRENKVVVVRLSEKDYPGTVAHLRQAWKAGEPRTLHLDRAGADENRDQSLQGIPTRPGYDRDEWPMAASSEGGEGAHIAYVPSSDNRGAGSVVGNALSGWCDGQAFTVRPVS